MRPITVRRPGAAAAALAASLLAIALAGCGSSPSVPSIGSLDPGSAPASGPATGGTTTGPASAAPSACSLLRSADVLAVAATFRGSTITIDGHTQVSQPPENLCGYNQKGVYTSDGMTSTMDGDQWAQLTVIADGNSLGDYSPDGPAIHGLGNGAYWDSGGNTVVVLVGQTVLEVTDQPPVNTGIYPDLATVFEQAATVLAAKILSHMPGR